MRISDWSADVCSSDLFAPGFFAQAKKGGSRRHGAKAFDLDSAGAGQEKIKSGSLRSRPHPPSGHLLPLAGEGLDIRPAGTFSRMRGRARSKSQQIPRIPDSDQPPHEPRPPPASTDRHRVVTAKSVTTCVDLGAIPIIKTK